MAEGDVIRIDSEGNQEIGQAFEAPKRVIYVGATDPADDFAAELITGDVWVRGVGSLAGQLKFRNAGNDGWIVGVDVNGDPWTTGWHIDQDTGTFSINAAAATITVEVDGTITLDAGAPNDAQVVLAADGSVVLTAADGANVLTLAANGSFELNGSGVVRLLGLPSADPEVAGQLYTDGAPAPGVPQALMVSGGPA